MTSDVCVEPAGIAATAALEGMACAFLPVVGVPRLARPWMARDAWRGVVGWLEAQRVAGAQRVQLGVRASNEGARRFYGALGFDEVGVHPRYDTDAEDAVLWLPGSA